MTIQHTRAYQATGNVPTPLASVVVGLFIDELWITRSLKSPLMRHSKLCASKYLSPNKNITRGIIYRQHNSPEVFQTYFEETIEQLAMTNKTIYI